MDPAILSTLIVALTPVITGLIKNIIPFSWDKEFKKIVPVIPPIVGAVLGIFGEQVGLIVTPELNNAVTGLALGCVGSSTYDALKANKKGK